MTKRQAAICDSCNMPVEDDEELTECDVCGNVIGSCCRSEDDPELCNPCSVWLGEDK